MNREDYINRHIQRVQEELCKKEVRANTDRFIRLQEILAYWERLADNPGFDEWKGKSNSQAPL